MKKAKEIAQWVIDNRYPKNENEKVSDVEMYHELVESIEKLCNISHVSGSFTAYDVERAYDDGYSTEGEVTFDIENYR